MSFEDRSRARTWLVCAGLMSLMLFLGVSALSTTVVDVVSGY